MSDVASLASFSNRELDPDEVRAYLEAPISDAERNEVLALVAWFRRRYPTPAERLAYARWQRTLGIGAQ